MVNKAHSGLRLRGAALAVLALVCLPASAITLTVHVNKTDVVLGGAIALEIVGVSPGDAPPLASLSLESLAADFELLDESRGTRTVGGTTTQRLTGQLYPRRAGKLRIPALRAGDARSTPIEITVRETGPERGRVWVRAGIEPEQPTVRSGALLYLDIYDSNDFTWRRPEPRAVAGLHLRTLAESQRDETIDGERYTVLRYRWAATALSDGLIEVRFESLQASKFGQRLRYGVMPFRFNARRVPSYVPVSVPMGAPEIQMESLPPEWIVGRPVNWRFTVTGSGLGVNGLKQLLGKTLGSGNEVRWYTPVVEVVDQAQAETPRQTFRVTVPVQALRHGDVELPALVLPYYDTQRERLAALTIPGARIAARDPLYLTAQRIGGAVIAILLVAGLVRIGAPWWRRNRRRRELFARIERARDVRELKSAVLEFAATPHTRTLRSWVRRTAAGAELQRWAAQLERACYTARDTDFAMLKNDARRLARFIPAMARSPD